MAPTLARRRRPGAPDDPRYEDSGVAELEDRLRAAKAPRRLFESDWILQIAFYLGHQWVKVDPAGLLYTVEVGDERVMLTNNLVRPVVRTNIAKKTKTQPQWVGVPRDGSDEEVTRARLRQIVFEHYWRVLRGRAKLQLAQWYVETTGTGWWKLGYDPTLGSSISVMAQRGGPVLLDGHGRPITPELARQAIPPEYQDGIEERRVTMGEATLQVKTPFEVAVDPLATDEGIETAEYIVEEAIYSPAYLARVFGADQDQLEADSGSFTGVVEARFPALGMYMERQRDNRGAAGRRGVKVREYWSLPGVDDPHGRHCVWTASGRKLLEEPVPYPFLPYVLFTGPPSGRFYADAPMKDLVSPQTEHNKSSSQVADNAERIGNPSRLTPIGSIDPDRPWQGLPGEDIVYNELGGTPPGYLQPPEMPMYVQQRPVQIEQLIDKISGQMQVASGGVPEGVTAASAINMLQEANDTQFGPDIGSMEDSILDAGRKLMWMLKAYASDERMARIAGDESAWDVYSWRGDELGGAEEDEVQIGSGIPASKAAKQAGIQYMLNLMIQNGQAPSPRELRRIMRDYEVGGLEHFFGSVGRDQTQIAEEHRRMLRGEPLPINTFDNDAIHIEEHQDFQKSSRYAQLATQPGGQLVQQAIEAHVDAHRQRASGQATAAAVGQMAQTAMEKGVAGPDPALALPGPDPGMVSSGDPLAGGTPDGALPSGEAGPSISPQAGGMF